MIKRTTITLDIANKKGTYIVEDISNGHLLPKKLSSKELDVTSNVIVDFSQLDELNIGLEDDLDINKDAAAASRAYFFTELWKQLGTKVTTLVVQRGLVSDLDYFGDAMAWLMRQGRNSPIYNLYSRADLFEPISQGEIGYLATFLFGLKPKLDWNKLNDPKLKVAIKTENVNGSPRAVLKLSQYKRMESFEDFLLSIFEGESPIPFPMYVGFEELKLRLNNKGVKTNTIIDILSMNMAEKWVRELAEMLRENN